MLGSHDSCACKVRNNCQCLCWVWSKTQDSSLTQQFNFGVRWFDIRYRMEDGVFYTSHTFSSSLTLEEALCELIECARSSDEYMIVRLKRDSASVPLPLLGNHLERIRYRGKPLSHFIVQDGLWSWNQLPYDNKRVVLYSDNETALEDNVPDAWMFPQLFDTVETWGCNTVEEAVQKINELEFLENGRPKALFIDFSSMYPPEVAFDWVWSSVKPFVLDSLKKGDIQLLVLNCIDSSLFD